MQMIIRDIIMDTVMMTMARAITYDISFHKPGVGHHGSSNDGFEVSLLVDVHDLDMLGKRMHVNHMFVTIRLAM
eukprot:4264612-Karenia_brevis.AAC.1